MSNELTQPQANSQLTRFRASGAGGAIVIAVVFSLAATGILMLRQQVIPYRPGQYVAHNITSRVDFDFPDADQLARMRQRAREQEPRVYRATAADYWGALQDELMTLPDRTYHRQLAELPEDLHGQMDPGDLSALERVHDRDREKYNQIVRRFVEKVRDQLTVGGSRLVILPNDQRQDELQRPVPANQAYIRYITLYPAKFDPATAVTPGLPAAGEAPQDVERRANVAAETYGDNLAPEVLAQLQNLADQFPLALKPAIANLTFAFFQQHPTHTLDLAASKAAQERAAADVPPSDATEHYAHDTVIVAKGPISDRDWQLLRAENQAYLAIDDVAWLKQLGGTVLTVLILTALLGAYVWRYQPRVVRNHLRAITLAALMLAMLLVSGLSGTWSGSLYFYGIAPTILAAIILNIAYDQRFAIGVGAVEAIFVTCALNQGIGFFLILLVGVLVVCFLLNDLRSRSKLIEVGGACAIAMMVVTVATELVSLESVHFAIHNSLYAGAAGLTAGFITLGILPFIERLFHITTSMTLLELADATQPLLRRLAMEAPGTYNHSLQVATLAEASAEAIGANALACRVGAYYHDIGKINKADYFTENQIGLSPSRHINLSPNVSLMIIISHVKDGMELARQANLPPTILQFIQQHHGTTLVEYFYHEACKQCPPDGTVPEGQFRYPGPKPKSRETAILMLSDCCESACRAMQQHSAGQIESLVHDMVLRRMRDGQFDECDLTMRDLGTIEKTLIKTLLSVYHGRIAYPTTSGYKSDSAGARKLA